MSYDYAMTCTTPGCNLRIICKGLCSKHYYRIKRGGTAEVSKRQQMALRKCDIAPCGKPHHSGGLCSMHLVRKRRHGDPNFVNPVCNRDGQYKTRHKEYVKNWKKENWEDYKPYLAARKARVKQATPPWADLRAIQEFYKRCPKGYHVDHIIPLNGVNVSGLHTIENLQYLLAADNLKKSNKAA